MQYSSYIENSILNNHSSGLIEVSSLWGEFFSDIPITAYNKTIERLEGKGKIVKLAKGVYCVPRETKFGRVTLGEAEILEHYIGKDNQYGVEVSYGLFSRLGLTTQVPQKKVIYTTRLEGNTKTYKNIILNKINVLLNKKRAELICGLEVCQNFENLQDVNYLHLYNYFSNLATCYDDEEFYNVTKEHKYKKKTLAFYQSMLNWFKVSNSIYKQLSPTSDYKIPKMEKIYELAH